MNQVYTNTLANPVNRGLSEANRSLAPAIWSSGFMAVAGMGDALLYAWLPVEGAALGMSALSIGILLSINKFVRFFTNRWVAWSAKTWGIRSMLLFGVLLASSTSFVYALNPAVWIWILSRMLWGISYSALRFSTLQYAGATERTGGALGIGRGIQEAGPLLAYWLGPIMLNHFGSEVVFSVLGLFPLIITPAIFYLSDFKSESQRIDAFRIGLPGKTDVWVFISSFVAEGLLIVGISGMINRENSDKLLVVSALYISSRRFLNMIVSPISGWLSDRWGFTKVFNVSCLMIISGVLLMGAGMTHVGVVTVFVGSAVNLTLLPVLALTFGPAEKNFDSLTKLSTSRDLGSGFGSLVGLSLLSVFHYSLIFGLLGVVLVSVWFRLRKFDKIYE